MTYATETDLITRFGRAELVQLTDRSGGNDVDSVVIARALADADAEIDAYLAARYELPLASTPPLLVRIAADIARYRLWGEAASVEVRQRYDDAVRLLSALANGTAALQVPVAQTAPATGITFSARPAVIDQIGGGG